MHWPEKKSLKTSCEFPGRIEGNVHQILYNLKTYIIISLRFFSFNYRMPTQALVVRFGPLLIQGLISHLICTYLIFGINSCSLTPQCTTCISQLKTTWYGNESQNDLVVRFSDCKGIYKRITCKTLLFLKMSVLGSIS